jgi:hypothetical protein
MSLRSGRHKACRSFFFGEAEGRGRGQSSKSKTRRRPSRRISACVRRSSYAFLRSASASSGCNQSVIRIIPVFETVVSPPRGPKRFLSMPGNIAKLLRRLAAYTSIQLKRYTRAIRWTPTKSAPGRV